MAPHYFRFDGNCGGEDRDEEVRHWVIDQVGRGAGVLTVDIAGVEVFAVAITMEDVQSAVNKTADEENT